MWQPGSALLVLEIPGYPGTQVGDQYREHVYPNITGYRIRPRGPISQTMRSFTPFSSVSQTTNTLEKTFESSSATTGGKPRDLGACDSTDHEAGQWRRLVSAK
eukprot:2140635-Rhodomonas_salina.3